MQPTRPINKHLVVVGDVHGQFNEFVHILRHARMIDDKNNWCGGNNKLLQIGDVIDRGPCSVEVNNLLDTLQKQAVKQGGEVIRLVGNHEVEVILGNFSISQLPVKQLKLFQTKFSSYVLTGQMKAAYAYKGFLITHAGVTRKLFSVLKSQLKKPTAADLAILLNFIFRESVAHRFYKHPIFNISTSRSGPSPYGGIFWEDINDLIASYATPSPVWQICGHTQVAYAAMDPYRHLIAIDVGMHRKLQYLEIDELGSVEIKTV